MYDDGGIFVFGAKTIYEDTKRSAIFSLPLEISWRIFSYLDDTSLQSVARAHHTWERIIIANKRLRSRLNKFELAIKLGSASLAKFYRRNKKRLILSTTKTVVKSKRGADDLTMYTKRFKLY